jgi:hypothetical protein
MKLIHLNIQLSLMDDEEFNVGKFVSLDREPQDFYFIVVVS